MISIEENLRELSKANLLLSEHISYLEKLRETTQPKVVYDIGACVLNWTKQAQNIWPEARYIAFEAMTQPKFLYEEAQIEHYCGMVLGNIDNCYIDFYENPYLPGGNSYYRENNEINPGANVFFSDNHRVKKLMRTLDSMIQEHSIPMPDMMKLDVQGAELDILQGATTALQHCQDIILELQHVEYNLGAPQAAAVMQFLYEQGFELRSSLFSATVYDGDYHFSKIK
jgi:FkbM family methyltransferase